MNATTITPDVQAFFDALSEALDTHARITIEDQAAVGALLDALPRDRWSIHKVPAIAAPGVVAIVTDLLDDSRWFAFVPSPPATT